MNIILLLMSKFAKIRTHSPIDPLKPTLIWRLDEKPSLKDLGDLNYFLMERGAFVSRDTPIEFRIHKGNFYSIHVKTKIKDNYIQIKIHSDLDIHGPSVYDQNSKDLMLDLLDFIKKRNQTYFILPRDQQSFNTYKGKSLSNNKIGPVSNSFKGIKSRKCRASLYRRSLAREDKLNLIKELFQQLKEQVFSCYGIPLDVRREIIKELETNLSPDNLKIYSQDVIKFLFKGKRKDIERRTKEYKANQENEIIELAKNHLSSHNLSPPIFEKLMQMFKNSLNEIPIQNRNYLRALEKKYDTFFGEVYQILPIIDEERIKLRKKFGEKYEDFYESLLQECKEKGLSELNKEDVIKRFMEIDLLIDINLEIISRQEEIDAERLAFIEDALVFDLDMLNDELER